MAETVRCTNCGTENIVDKDNKLCKECGKDLSKYVQKEVIKKIKKIKSPISFFKEITLFIIFMLAIGGLIFGMFSNIFDYVLNKKHWGAEEEQNILHSIYYMADNIDNYMQNMPIALNVAFALIISILFILGIWSIFKFNRIEKNIFEIKEILTKENNKE